MSINVGMSGLFKQCVQQYITKTSVLAVNINQIMTLTYSRVSILLTIAHQPEESIITTTTILSFIV